MSKLTAIPVNAFVPFFEITTNFSLEPWNEIE